MTNLDNNPVLAAPSEVAMLCSGDEVYGVGTVLKIYAQSVPGLRFICMRNGPMMKWLLDHNVDVVHFPALADFQAAGSLATLARLPGAFAQARNDAARMHEHLKSKGIRIVHTHWLSQQIIGGFLRSHGYKVVWHIHNNMNRNRLRGWGMRLNHLLANWGADAIIAVSDFIKTNYSGSRVPLHTIHNAATRYYEAPNRLPAGPIRCLTSGRLIDRKGHHLAVQAVLAARRAGLDVRLDIYGGPIENNAYVDQLKDLIKRENANEEIRFMGFCEDLRARHQQYHIGLQCRIDPEPCSMWVCEASTDGLPLLASSTGGTPEIVKDGQTGILFRSGDADDLSKKLIALASDRKRMEEMRVAAFEHGNGYLTSQRFVAETFDVYKSMLQPDAA